MFCDLLKGTQGVWPATYSLDTPGHTPGLKGSNKICAENQREMMMIKEERLQVLEEKKPGKMAEEDAKEAQFQTEWSSLRHSGQERYQMGFGWPVIRNQGIHRASRQPERAESKRLIGKQHRLCIQQLQLQIQGHCLDLWVCKEDFWSVSVIAARLLNHKQIQMSCIIDHGNRKTNGSYDCLYSNQPLGWLEIFIWPAFGPDTGVSETVITEQKQLQRERTQWASL